jgi:hypothetical protein
LNRYTAKLAGIVICLKIIASRAENVGMNAAGRGGFFVWKYGLFDLETVLTDDFNALFI